MGFRRHRRSYRTFKGSVPQDEASIIARTKTAHFDSLSEFGQKFALTNSFGHSVFYNGSEMVQASKRAQTGGNSDLVPEAEKLVREFEDALDIEMLRPEWRMDVAGARPSIPAYLAGYPENMFRLRQVDSDRTPLTIWVCVTSSGGCSEEKLFKRGLAITALFMALSAMRPVTLRIFSGLSTKSYGLGNMVMSVELTQPIVLGEVAWTLSDQEFSRGMTYAYLDCNLYAGGGWPSDCSQGSRDDRIERWRIMLGAGNDDIIFPHSFMGDADLNDPIGFCKAIMAEFSEE